MDRNDTTHGPQMIGGMPDARHIPPAVHALMGYQIRPATTAITGSGPVAWLAANPTEVRAMLAVQAVLPRVLDEMPATDGTDARSQLGAEPTGDGGPALVSAVLGHLRHLPRWPQRMLCADPQDTLERLLDTAEWAVETEIRERQNRPALAATASRAASAQIRRTEYADAASA